MISRLKEAAAAANPPTQAQLEFLERMEEMLKQGRLKNRAAGAEWHAGPLGECVCGGNQLLYWYLFDVCALNALSHTVPR